MATITSDNRPDNRLLVWTIVASHFGPPFMVSGVAVALPALGRELGAGATALGLIETTFLAGSLAFLLPAGRLADAIDKRALFKVGLWAFGLLSVALGLSSSVPVILVLRFLQGAASAMFAATSTALLADLVPSGQRGRVFGASMGVVYAGLSLGPMVAGVMVTWWSWRAVFLFGAVVILGGAALVAARLSSKWRRPGGAVHLPSVVLITAAVLAASFGSALLRRGWYGLAALVAALLLAVAFVAVQLAIDRPLLDLRAVRANASLRAALLVQLVLYLNAFCSMFLLSLYLQVSCGCSPDTAGRVLAVGSLVMAIVAPLAGMLADRVPARLVTAAGAAAVLASALVARTLAPGSDLGDAVLVLVLQGLGFGLFSSPNMAIIIGSMPDAQSGMASALAAMARSIGMVTGMLLTACLISLDFGDAPVGDHPLQFVATMTTVYSVLAVTATVALLVTVFAGDRPRAA